MQVDRRQNDDGLRCLTAGNSWCVMGWAVQLDQLLRHSNTKHSHMPAYYRETVSAFLRASPGEVANVLHKKYADDGFASQYTRQTRAWVEVIPLLQAHLQDLVAARPEANQWSLLLEYPLYRLRRRIDMVVLAGDTIVVVECKVGADTFSAQDRRQVEE